MSPPGEGFFSQYDGVLSSSFWSTCIQSLYICISRLTVWFDELDDTARLILLVSTVASLSFTTWYLYCTRRVNAMARVLLLLFFVYAIGLFALNHTSQTARPTGTRVLDGQDDVLAADSDVGQDVIPNIFDPEAVDPQEKCPGYKAYNVRNTKLAITADLVLAGPACNVYGNDIEVLSLLVEHQSADRLHVEIKPKYIGPDNYTWFELPPEILQKPGMENSGAESDLVFHWSNDPIFEFSVSRKNMHPRDLLFSTEGTRIVFEDQFIEFKSMLPEAYNLYGLGEVIHGLRLGNNLTRTLFTADVGDDIDANIYGHHPIYYDTRYFEVSDDRGKEFFIYKPIANAADTHIPWVSKTHGVFNRNAHTQEILLRERGITWRALGGSIDLYFFQGPTHTEVAKSYQKSIIGLPALQQLWTFGFHQCRWGYQSWKQLQEVVDNFKKFKIPLETIWTDIDYMNKYRDFENDAQNFGYEEGAEFISRIHENKMHYIPIVDAAIYAPNPNSINDSYPTFDRGVKENAFMMNPDGSLYIGAVWPGYTVFPDWVGAVFNGSGTFQWWAAEFAKWHEKIKFDGIWIDMNEVSSFCVGSCGSGKRQYNPLYRGPVEESLDYPEGFNITNATEAASASAAKAAKEATKTFDQPASTSTSYYRTTPTPGVRNINWPPYTINNFAGDLAVHAVSPNATHHGGFLEYDFHNVFGHQMIDATRRALLDIFPTKRPFIISRSQFAGSGKWGAHWGGDNWSLWAYMYFSIPQALSYSLFGIPMFGVDVCGFGGNTDMELCSRWMQLGAFFPFYRNHNVQGARSQEPYVWAEVAEASKKAMEIRYALLPYIYTTMYLGHTTGSMVMRALAWDFPDEPWLGEADRQFLLGDAIMVIPCLEQGASTVKGVFPGVGSEGTVWYDWYTQTRIRDVGIGENVTIDAPLGHIPVYIKGGYVIPLKEPDMTVADTRDSPWSLIIALDIKGKARGKLYLDDGEALNPTRTTMVDFTANMSSITVTMSSGTEFNFTDTTSLANITILGFEGPAAKGLRMRGQEVTAGVLHENQEKDVLKITELESLTLMEDRKSVV